MRLLKFRLYDLRNKKWIHGPGGECSLFGEMILMGGWCPISIEKLNDMLALQYTGLKDKHGVDVYEGDIVRFHTCFHFLSPKRAKENKKAGLRGINWTVPNSCIRKVVMSEEGAWLPFNDNQFIQDEQGDWFDDEWGFEIVDDIHSKPELFEDLFKERLNEASKD